MHRLNWQNIPTLKAMNLLGLMGFMIQFAINFTETPVLAQITPDNSLGAERSQFTPGDLIRGGRDAATTYSTVFRLQRCEWAGSLL